MNPLFCSLVFVFALSAVTRGQETEKLKNIAKAWEEREMRFSTFQLEVDEQSIGMQIADPYALAADIKAGADSGTIQVYASGNKLRIDADKTVLDRRQVFKMVWDGATATELRDPDIRISYHVAYVNNFKKSSFGMVAKYVPIYLAFRPLTLELMGSNLESAAMEENITVRGTDCLVFRVGVRRYFVANDEKDFRILRAQRVGTNGSISTQFELLYDDEGVLASWMIYKGHESSQPFSATIAVVKRKIPVQENISFKLDFPPKTHVINSAGPNIVEFDVPSK